MADISTTRNQALASNDNEEGEYTILANRIDAMANHTNIETSVAILINVIDDFFEYAFAKGSTGLFRYLPYISVTNTKSWSISLSNLNTRLLLNSWSYVTVYYPLQLPFFSKTLCNVKVLQIERV